MTRPPLAAYTPFPNRASYAGFTPRPPRTLHSPFHPLRRPADQPA